MPDYQLYHLNDKGGFGDFDRASLADDAEALQFARARFKGRPGELWSLGRRIAAIEIRNGEPAVIVFTQPNARRQAINEGKTAPHLASPTGGCFVETE